MATERKTYEYSPFEYKGYQKSNEVKTAGQKKNDSASVYDNYLNTGYQKSNEVITAGQNKNDSASAYDNYLNNGYQKSDEVITAGQNKSNAENALAGYGDFSYGNQAAFNDIMNRILNREKFSYDVNGDALYQQYKDQYINQGKMAMQDTMGQAAAMTGGYGSSYAASVGNQAYQASLQQLNDVIPQLYQMALDKYNMEGQDLYNQYGMLSDDRNTQYGMWGDKRNMLVADRDYYSNDYNNTYNRDYGQWVDKGNMLDSNRNYWSNEYNNTYNRDYGQWVDKGNMLDSNRNYYSNEYNNAYNRDYGQYVDNRNLAYNDHTTSEGYKYQDVADANAYAQWKANYDEGVRQYNKTMEWNAEQARLATKTAKANAIAAAQNAKSSSPTLSAKEYNDVLMNAEAYADMGETALANYLNGMVARGLSQDEAADILEQYFPALTVNKPTNNSSNKTTTVFDKNTKFNHTLN
jgi:hypothetical protein